MFAQQQIQDDSGAGGARVRRVDSRGEDAPELSDRDVEDEGAEGDGLEEAAEDEHEYVRARLREELQREPTEEELDEWLRRHTEGY